MYYSIDFESDALEELKALRKGEQVKILKTVEMHLRFEPTLQSKSRIKHLRPGTRPPYRLRIDDFRVYYDIQIEDQRVIVYGVVHKDQSLEWLAAFVQKIAAEEESNEDNHSQ